MKRSRPKISRVQKVRPILIYTGKNEFYRPTASVFYKNNKIVSGATPGSKELFATGKTPGIAKENLYLAIKQRGLKT